MIHMTETRSDAYGVWWAVCDCGWQSPIEPALTDRATAHKAGDTHLADANGAR